MDLNRDLTGASDLHGGDLNENDEMYDEKWECTALDADMEIWKQVLCSTVNILAWYFLIFISNSYN